MTHRGGPRRPLPEWLVGLLIAIAIVVVGAIVLSMLGAGDDPTFTTRS